jgi:ATP-binding cassette subfamily B protein
MQTPAKQARFGRTWFEGTLFGRIDRIIGRKSGLFSQTVGYAAVGVGQGTVFALLVPALSRLLGRDVNAATGWVIALAAAATCTGVLLWAVTERGYHLSVERLHDGVQRAVGRTVTRLPLGWFNAGRSGEVSTLVTTGAQDIMSIPNTFLQQMTVALSTPATVVLVTAFIDWRMALALVAVSPLAWLAYRRVGKSVDREHREEGVSQAAVSSAIIEFAQAQQVLRASGAVAGESLAINRQLARNREDGKAALASQTGPTGVFTMLVELGFAITFAVGTYLALGGGLSVPVFAGLLVLAARFVEPLTQIGIYGVALQQARISLESIDRLIATPCLPEPKESKPRNGTSIELDDVRFAYRKRAVLNGLSLTVPANSMTALVGPSGGGKSTVLRLIARFWDVDSGAVRIGGADVRDTTTADLMSSIAMVFQDVYLFDDTIWNNVRIAKPSASDDQIRAALESAGLADTLSSLPDGAQTRVGEAGGLLSGGERQRVAIARAFLKDAPILLLDEATSALDGQTEAAVTTALERFAENRTVLVIAHRLTTIANADQIAVLTDGRISELGTHQQLLDRRGTYWQFWNDRANASGWTIDGADSPDDANTADTNNTNATNAN